MKVDNIKYFYEQNGYFIFNSFYDNNQMLIIDFEDKNGYKYRFPYNYIKYYKKIKPITKSNYFSVENIKNYIRINNLNVTLLSKSYENINSPLTFLGKCNHIFYKDWHHFQRKRIELCPACSLAQGAIKRKITKEDYRKLFAKNKIKIVYFPHCFDTSTLMLCKNENGYYGYINYRNLSMGKTFSEFSKNNKMTNFNIDIFLKRNSKTIRLSQYECSDSLLKLKCNCGNIFYRTWDNLKQNKGIRCDNCLQIMSNNEKNIEDYLIENNLIYCKQFVFENCVNERSLKFDFYLPNEKIAIEVNGEQHYFPVRFGGITLSKAQENFKKQKIRDDIKKEYCIKNNIKLLIISYKDILNKTYIQKLKQIRQKS